MRHVVDFRTSADTGETDNLSIVPVSDGEPSNQVVHRRPSENLRTRSEALRDVAVSHVILSDVDHAGPLMRGGGTITFNGAAITYTGKFTTTADLVVSSFATPGDDTIPSTFIGSTQAVLSVGTPANNEIVFTSVQKQFEGASLAAADTNRISVEIVNSGAVSVVVNDNHNVYITIVAGTTTCQDVIDAVTASVPASALVVVTMGAGSTNTNPASTWAIADWAGDYSLRFLRGGAAGITHIVPATAITNFFLTAANILYKGDTLGIWYDQAIDTSLTGGRLQSTPENGNTTLTAANLFNSRREPAKIPNSIPICKCVGDDLLIFSDGSYITRGVPAQLHIDSSFLLNAELGILATPLGWTRLNAGIHTPPTTIRQALDNADDDLETTMAEVEAGRDSTIFGAQASLDARLEAGDTHSRAFVSVTDGTLSTGGMYNGAAALATAIQDMDAAGEGGRILVRRGTYTVSSALTIASAIHIIGVEDDVIIDSTGLADWAITFAPTASRPSQAGIENVKFVGQRAVRVQVNSKGSQVSLRNLWCETNGAVTTSPVILISGTEVVLENIRLDGNLVTGPTAGIIFDSSAERCTLRNGYFTGFDLSLVTEGHRITVENITADITFDTGIAVSCSGNDNIIRNIRVLVSNTITPSGSVIYLNGYRARIENVSCEKHSRCLWIDTGAQECVLENLTLNVWDSGVMLEYVSSHMNTVRQVAVVLDDSARVLDGSSGTLLHLEDVNVAGSSVPGTNIFLVNDGMTLRNIRVTWDSSTNDEISGRILATGSNTEDLLLDGVYIDFNYHKLQYDPTSPIFISGTGITVRNCSFVNFYVPHDSEELDADNPIVQYESQGDLNQRILFDNCRFGNFSHAMTPSGDMTVALLGCVNNDEAHGAIFRNCKFYTTGITFGALMYPWGGGRYVFYRTGSHTDIETCDFEGSGKFTSIIAHQGGTGFVLCHSYMAISNCPYAFISSVAAPDVPNHILLEGNDLTVAGGTGTSSILIVGQSGDEIGEVTITKNKIYDGSPDATLIVGFIDNLIVTDNYLSDGVKTSDPVSNSIVRFVLSNNVSEGNIEIDRVSNVTMIGNIIAGTVNIDNVTNVSMTGNTVSSTVDIDNVTNMSMTGNTVSGVVTLVTITKLAIFGNIASNYAETGPFGTQKPATITDANA